MVLDNGAVSPPCPEAHLQIENTVLDLRWVESTDVKPRDTRADCIFIEKISPHVSGPTPSKPHVVDGSTVCTKKP